MDKVSSKHRQIFATASLIGFPLAYLCAEFLRWPRLMYQPVTRRWYFSDTLGDDVMMSYWGLVLWGLLGAAGASALAITAAMLWPRLKLPTSLGAAWAIAAVVVCGSYFTWVLWP